MKSLNYAAISSLCALAIGILLVVWPEAAIIYLVITVGVLFLLPGLFGLFSYYAASRHKDVEMRRSFPIVALGSTLLGFWLMIMPEFFVNILMYLLGALLVLGGLSQLINFISVRQAVKVPLLFLSGFCVDSGIWCCYSVQSVPGSYRSVYCFGSNSHCICGKRSDSLVVLSPQTE